MRPCPHGLVCFIQKSFNTHMRKNRLSIFIIPAGSTSITARFYLNINAVFIQTSSLCINSGDHNWSEHLDHHRQEVLLANHTSGLATHSREITPRAVEIKEKCTSNRINQLFEPVRSRTLQTSVVPPFICIICIRVYTHGRHICPRGGSKLTHHTWDAFGTATRRQICASLFRDHEPRGTFNKFTTSHIDSKKENNKRENKQPEPYLRRTQLFDDYHCCWTNVKIAFTLRQFNTIMENDNNHINEKVTKSSQSKLWI